MEKTFAMFREYFGYQSQSFLVEDLLKANNSENKQIVNHNIFSTNELENDIIKMNMIYIYIYMISNDII